MTATLSRSGGRFNYTYPGSRILCTLFANPRSTCFGFDNPVLEQYRSSAFQPQNRLITSSEIRYASAWSGPLQLVGGAFYENEDNNFLSTVYARIPSSTSSPRFHNIYGNRFVHNAVEQDALFGELTYNHHACLVSDRRLPGVQVRYRPAQPESADPDPGRAAPRGGDGFGREKRHLQGQHPIQVRRRPAGLFHLLAGFRSGGNNEPDFTTGTVLPPYKSDSLDSYELGGKGKFFHGAVEADLAIYDMEWKDLQQRISAGIAGSSVQHIANVGSARIRGAEARLERQADCGTRPAGGRYRDGTAGCH